MNHYKATLADGTTVSMTKEEAITAIVNARSPLDAPDFQRSRAEARGLLALIDDEGLDGLFFEHLTIRARRIDRRAIVALVVPAAVACLWMLVR